MSTSGARFTNKTTERITVMKKIVFSMLVALGCVMGSYAASDTQYKVYDVKMSLKTSKAAGTTSTSCGDQYVYRVKSTRKVEGVIAGCGCITAAGDPSYDNFVMYFWDATTRTALTNCTYKTEVLQRIGKKGDQVEQIVTFVVTDQDGEEFELTLAGFGTYKVSRSGSNFDTLAVSGNVTGVMDAPFKVTLGSCVACFTTPDSVDQSNALAICEDGSCVVSDTTDVTPVYGTYTMKYNKSKAKKCERSGATPENLGVPAYAR